MLASTAARELEASCSRIPGVAAAARGRLCFVAPADRGAGLEPAALLNDLLDPELGAALVLAVCEPADFRALLDPSLSRRRAVLLKASPGSDRPLIALLATELRGEGVPMKAWVPAIGPVAARRALAGLDAGGDSGRRAERLLNGLLGLRDRSGEWVGSRLRAERAQALPAVLGISILVVCLALALVAIGGAATAKGRLQRGADLAAISAARSMRDDFGRLFVPAFLPGGSPNPVHLSRSEYLDRARATAATAAERNDLDPALVEVGFPDGRSFAPLRVRVAIDARIVVAGTSSPRAVARPRTGVSAEAEVTLAPGAGAATSPTVAGGGGYEGPLAYRQGKPMRPDVAAAFDRMANAAGSAGVSLVVNSAYRSDAEQQRPLGCQSRPPLGGPSRYLLASVRHRARPRAAGGVRLAGGECGPLRLPAALRLGTLALRVRPRAGALLRSRGSGRRTGVAGSWRRARGGWGRAAVIRPREVQGGRCSPPRRATTSPHRCSRRS